MKTFFWWDSGHSIFGIVWVHVQTSKRIGFSTLLDAPYRSHSQARPLNDQSLSQNTSPPSEFSAEWRARIWPRIQSKMANIDDYFDDAEDQGAARAWEGVSAFWTFVMLLNRPLTTFYCRSNPCWIALVVLLNTPLPTSVDGFCCVAEYSHGRAHSGAHTIERLMAHSHDRLLTHSPRAFTHTRVAFSPWPGHGKWSQKTRTQGWWSTLVFWLNVRWNPSKSLRICRLSRDAVGEG
jgi:hypothetical protein